ncbi:TetR/AcrR family transcriptional regulator [Azospirillum sp. CT11-132]|uniref:TetR/AcrR family transcriptional regulator n=1 Tax=unclassified Azospirillum TaxID=2630922 RepID=UPI000D6143F4|nr:MULTISPECIES: TetR/AcrR family transcriptional regulator [unclassified Azospirillum]PWC61339.1 TetR family transcriptional regulator [Azospirillum sp. TSH20]PWC67738.1 TetR family transcriptional regulator [Azospirillum sp. TSH7]
MSGLRERKRMQTLDHIARIAFALFEQHGYEAVTMEQIAGEAQVAKGTLYRYFPVKEAVLAHWFHAELAHDMQSFSPPLLTEGGFAQGVTVLLHASAQWCETHRTYLPPYLRHRFLAIGSPQPEPAGVTRSDIVDAFEALVQRGQGSGELRTDMSSRQLAASFHHLYLAAMLRWLNQPELVLQTEFEAVVALFLQGATARHGAP